MSLDFFALSIQESLERLLDFGYETISCNNAALRTNFWFAFSFFDILFSLFGLIIF